MVIPDHVTAIGEGAFSTCENLTDVTIPGHFAKQEDYQWWSARFSEPTLTILALQNFKPDAPVVDHIVNRSKTSCDVAFLFLLEKIPSLCVEVQLLNCHYSVHTPCCNNIVVRMLSEPFFLSNSIS